MRLYRDNFRPSASHAKPYAILATHVVCADTDEEAERLAKTVDLNIVRRAKGEYLPLASPEDAAAYDYSPVDRARIAQNRTRMSVGAPATVKARLEPLIAATKADELMVDDHDLRPRRRANIPTNCWRRLHGCVRRHTTATTTPAAFVKIKPATCGLRNNAQPPPLPGGRHGFIQIVRIGYCAALTAPALDCSVCRARPPRRSRRCRKFPLNRCPIR